MAANDFSQVPATVTLSPKPFKAHIPEEKLQQMKDLVRLSPIGPAVWENSSDNQGESHFGGPKGKHGMRRDWLTAAKDHWLHKFDWRASEDRINSFPNYTVDVTGADGIPFTVHFVALFSHKDNAIPLAFYHGWPGSFLEFLKILDILRTKYTPDTIPYHVIVPSLPGYTFTSGPPVDKDYNLRSASDVLHNLMTGLGFTSYVAQGGDLGSSVCRYQATNYPECRSIHLNLLSVPASVDQEKNKESMSATEAQALPRGAEFGATGFAYGKEHGTRTGTIGLALSASPVALLAWIGEKFLEWSDEDPSVDEILESVSLYWLTDTFPRCIYPYRGDMRPKVSDKPFGFSFFPKELMPSPKHLVEQMGNLVAYYSHENGGHFAAFEQPETLLADVEDWISKVWTKSKL